MKKEEMEKLEVDDKVTWKGIKCLVAWTYTYGKYIRVLPMGFSEDRTVYDPKELKRGWKK